MSVSFDTNVENYDSFGFLYIVHNVVDNDSRSSAQWFHMCFLVSLLDLPTLDRLLFISFFFIVYEVPEYK